MQKIGKILRVNFSQNLENLKPQNRKPQNKIFHKKSSRSTLRLYFTVTYAKNQKTYEFRHFIKLEKPYFGPIFRKRLFLKNQAPLLFAPRLLAKNPT